jgi:hypothetical protein
VRRHHSLSLDFYFSSFFHLESFSLQRSEIWKWYKQKVCCNIDYLWVVGLKWIFAGSPWLSIRDAVFTVSPKRQYLGIFWPTTPATTGPVCIPTRICNKQWGYIILIIRYTEHWIAGNKIKSGCGIHSAVCLLSQRTPITSLVWG